MATYSGTHALAQLVTRSTKPTVSSLAKSRPRTTSLSLPTGQQLPSARSRRRTRTLSVHQIAPIARTFQHMPIELVWVILTFAAASSKAAALRISTVCREARHLSIPHALSVFPRWTANVSFRINRDLAYRAFRLPHIRHLSLGETWLEHGAFPTLLSSCPLLSDLCLSEFHLRRLFILQTTEPDPAEFTEDLALTLCQFPRDLGDYPPLDARGALPQLCYKVTSLRLPPLDYAHSMAFLARLLASFPNLARLALPLVPARDALAPEARVNALARLLRGLRVQTLVALLYRESWLAAQRGLAHYASAAHRRLYAYAVARDARIHVVCYGAWGPDEADIREQWEAEAWGAESVWEKAARIRHRELQAD